MLICFNMSMIKHTNKFYLHVLCTFWTEASIENSLWKAHFSLKLVKFWTLRLSFGRMCLCFISLWADDAYVAAVLINSSLRVTAFCWPPNQITGFLNSLQACVKDLLTNADHGVCILTVQSSLWCSNHIHDCICAPRHKNIQGIWCRTFQNVVVSLCIELIPIYNGHPAEGGRKKAYIVNATKLHVGGIWYI